MNQRHSRFIILQIFFDMTNLKSSMTKTCVICTYLYKKDQFMIQGKTVNLRESGAQLDVLWSQSLIDI